MLFNATASAPCLMDKFHPIKDIILFDQLTYLFLVSICLETSSRWNSVLKLVGANLVVLLELTTCICKSCSVRCHLRVLRYFHGG